jgi:aspartyl-tRNA(Asn)/glutamyl-tRNA(Gln) amidotransferase subunit A
VGGAFETLSDLSQRLASREVSAVELVSAALERAEATQSTLHAFAGLRGDRARAEASESDARRRRGEPRSEYDGIPVAIKDNMVQTGEPTTCASRILEGFVSPYTATAVERIERAGAVVIGRTNMDEFAMGSSTEHSSSGPTRNPWRLANTPGGSSGGSAAAVAAGIVPAALGSDTGGSIRQPASFCGVVGIKPTYGRVSRWGLVAFASSLDQIGVFTRSARDAAGLLERICGHDPFDSTSIPEPAPELRAALDGDVSGLVLGLPKECFVAEGVDPGVLAAVRDAVAELERAGAKVREISLPHTRYAIATYYLIATAEASSNLARFDGVRYGRRARGARSLTEMYERTRSEGFGEEVKRRILLGTYVLSAGYYDAYYRKAQQVRTLLRRDFERAFGACDVIVTPTSPEVAFELGAKTSDPLSMYLSDIYTVSANLAGIPGVSIPCGLVRGLPVGLQLLGPVLGESVLLRVADVFERRTPHQARRPELGP